jgi:hypothetical protein
MAADTNKVHLQYVLSPPPISLLGEETKAQEWEEELTWCLSV